MTMKDIIFGAHCAILYACSHVMQDQRATTAKVPVPPRSDAVSLNRKLVMSSWIPALGRLRLLTKTRPGLAYACDKTRKHKQN